MSHQPETTTAEYWLKRWENNDIEWQRDTVNKFLIKYIHELTSGRSNLRVFVPLCGKSIDMLWLADQGHSVVGVEVAKLGIESFFEENSLTFSLEKVKLAAAVDLVDVYKCVEKQITIFAAIYLLSQRKTLVGDSMQFGTVVPCLLCSQQSETGAKDTRKKCARFWLPMEGTY